MLSLCLLVLHTQAPCLGRAPPAGGSPFPDGGQGQWRRGGRDGTGAAPAGLRSQPERRGPGALLGREGRPAGPGRSRDCPGALPVLPWALWLRLCGSWAVTERGCVEMKVLVNPALCRSSSFRGNTLNARNRFVLLNRKSLFS